MALALPELFATRPPARLTRLSLALLATAVVAVIAGGASARVSPMLLVAVVCAPVFIALAAYRPWLALWFYLGTLVLSPNYVGVSLGPLGDWTPTRGVAALFIGGRLLRTGVGSPRFHALDLCFIGYLLTTMLFLPLKGVTASGTVKSVLFTALDAVVPYLVMRTMSTDRDAVKHLLRMLMFWTTIVAILAVIEIIVGDNPFIYLGPQLPTADQWALISYRPEGQRAQVSFGHPISLGLFAALLLPIGIWMARWETGWRRPVAWAATAMTGVMLLLTWSRGPLIGAFVALTLMALVQPSGRRRSLFILGCTVATVLAIYLSGATPLTSLIDDSFVSGTEASVNIQGRQALLDRVWGVWTSSPMIGFRDQATATRFLSLVSIDNAYLFTLVSYGLPALVAFLTIPVVMSGRLLWYARGRPTLAADLVDLAIVLMSALIGQYVILATVALVGLGPQVFWAVLGLAAGPWLALDERHRPVAAQPLR